MYVCALGQILPIEIQQPLFSGIHCALNVVFSFQKLILSSNISSTLQGLTIYSFYPIFSVFNPHFLTNLLTQFLFHGSYLQLLPCQYPLPRFPCSASVAVSCPLLLLHPTLQLLQACTHMAQSGPRKTLNLCPLISCGYLVPIIVKANISIFNLLIFLDCYRIYFTFSLKPSTLSYPLS